jgi:hypothetical protein
VRKLFPSFLTQRHKVAMEEKRNLTTKGTKKREETLLKLRVLRVLRGKNYFI